jgi:hypothetical protein
MEIKKNCSGRISNQVNCLSEDSEPQRCSTNRQEQCLFDATMMCSPMLLSTLCSQIDESSRITKSSCEFGVGERNKQIKRLSHS